MGVRAEREALAVAAHHAQGMIEQKELEKAKLMEKVASMDAELAALHMVVKMFGNGNAEPKSKAGRLPNGEWPRRIGEVLTEKSLTLNDLHIELQKRFNVRLVPARVQELLENGEKHGRFQKDETRQWSNVNNMRASAPGG